MTPGGGYLDGVAGLAAGVAALAWLGPDLVEALGEALAAAAREAAVAAREAVVAADGVTAGGRVAVPGGAALWRAGRLALAIAAAAAIAPLVTGLVRARAARWLGAGGRQERVPTRPPGWLGPLRAGLAAAALALLLGDLAARHAGDLARLARLGPERAGEVVAALAAALLVRAAAAMAVIGAFDAVVRGHAQGRAPTAEERRRELRETEGSPLIRQRRRQRHREIGAGPAPMASPGGHGGPIG